MSKFQLIFTGIFAVFIVVGVITFALFKAGSGTTVARATIWGTMRSEDFSAFLHASTLDTDKTLSVSYVEKNPQTFNQDFIEALALGTGPDIIFLPQESVLINQDKLFVVPFTNYPERTFKDTFIQEGELYLTKDGIIGFPFTVDPLVMYWNRDIFTNAGLSQPPKLWNDFYDLTQKLTRKQGDLSITQSAVALGEFVNVSHATELLSTLIMQAGSPITARTDSGVNIVFNNKFDFTISPAESALNFYTQFSDPQKLFYSWNRALPLSKNYFLSGNLATYFGFASELPDIQAKNPNLNFDLAEIPQSSNRAKLLTYGKMNALAIVKSSKDISAAFKVITALTTSQAGTALSSILHLPPVRRDLLATSPSDATGAIFYRGAIQAAGWLNPNANETNKVFKNMIESIGSGRASSGDAVNSANEQLRLLFK